MDLGHVCLAVAIGFGVLATSASRATDGFARPLPPLIAIGGHAFAFHFLSPTPRTMPVGPIHAIWSGAGIVPVAAVGWTLFRQTSTHRPMPVRACWRSPRAGRGSRLPTCR